MVLYARFRPSEFYTTEAGLEQYNQSVSKSKEPICIYFSNM